jgi:N-ethylmaleimide reductase
MAESSTLFQPFSLGPTRLTSRIVMAPMTRNRAIGNVPNELMATYYRQRAAAGLIITEGVAPMADGLGYARIPALFDGAHVAGWQRVTAAVHGAGGKILAQLMHTGRASHVANLPPGARVMAPSAIPLPEGIWVDPGGPQPASPPIAMTEADIERTLAGITRSAELAIEAGFDGIELHGANGYLIDQFLNTASNQRADRWGGTVENRARFAVELARRCAAAIGAGRVGMRVSPYGAFNAMVTDAAHEELFATLASQLSEIGLAHLHIVDHSAMGAPAVAPSVKQTLRRVFRGAIILSGGYDRARAEADLAEGKGDLVAFGRPFLANPDLVEKLRTGAALTPPDFATFYTPGERGYTDYPGA